MDRPLPKVLVITGENKNTLASLSLDIWDGLLSSLKATSDVTITGNLRSHLTCLAEVTSSRFSSSPKRYGSSSLGEISVVLVVSAESYLSSQKPYRILRDHVKTFADQQGGIVLFCATFSSFIKPTSFDVYFRNEWKLPWRFGDYHRTTLSVNQSFHIISKDSHTTVKLDPKTASLEKAYSQKAVHVKNASINSMLYVTTSASQLESRVFPTRSVDNKSQSPVIFSPTEKDM